MMRRLAVLTVLAALVLAAACGGVRPSKFYTLDIPSAPAASGAPVPADLLIGRVSAPQFLRDDRIVYRTGSTELGNYEYHRWADPPSLLIEELLLRTLRDSGHYRSVQSQKSNTKGDFIVRGRLYEFGEITGTSLAARLKIEFELYDPRSGTVVFSKLYSRDEPVSGKEVPGVVEALNQNMQRALSDFSSSLSSWFAQHPPKQS